LKLKGIMMILTPKEIASDTGRDSKTVRRIMRSMTDEQPGSGARWQVESGSDFHVALVKRLTESHNRKTIVATLKGAPVAPVAPAAIAPVAPIAKTAPKGK
jgi:hypothetical protein